MLSSTVGTVDAAGGIVMMLRCHWSGRRGKHSEQGLKNHKLLSKCNNYLQVDNQNKKNFFFKPTTEGSEE